MHHKSSLNIDPSQVAIYTKRTWPHLYAEFTYHMSSFLYAERRSLEQMEQAFSQVPAQVKRFWVGFSGGLDSHVLLHATRDILTDASVTAIHVNHGLQTQASLWERHCQMVCDGLQIPLVIHQVSEQLHQYRQLGASPEDAARKARYAALTHQLTEEDCLLTAHHAEDQAETLLLQLMRGAGVQGLGSMQLFSRSNEVYHLRPLLYWNSQDRFSYAKKHRLQWIEDPSNQDQRFTRNFIRHTVIPSLKQRWPKSTQALGRAAAHCAEASQLSEELAILDLSTCEIEKNTLSIPALLNLSLLRRRNALRYWLQRILTKSPSTSQFEHIEQLLYAKNNTGFHFQSVIIQRYQSNLYCINQKDRTQHQLYQSIQWNTAEPLHLVGWGTLTAITCYGEGIRTDLLKKSLLLEVRFRQGGERMHEKGRSGSHPLRKLFQEWSVSPWERYQWPLLYHQKQLVAVPGYAVSQKNAANPQEPGLFIQVTRASH